MSRPKYVASCSGGKDSVATLLLAAQHKEPLDEAVLDRAVCHIQQADLLLIGGTSLNVYPAAGLIRYFQGRDLVIINREPTPADRRASLVIQGSIGEIFAAL